MLINNTSSTLRLVSKQCLYFVLPHTTPVRINGEPYGNKLYAVNIFGISPVVKQYHLLPSSIAC